MTDTPMPPVQSSTETGGSAPWHEDEVSRISELHTRLLDTLQGYDKIIEKAEPEFIGVARQFQALHHDQSLRIASMLVQLGHDPDKDGSVFGSVNRALVEMRSWFDDIGHNVIDALRHGEQHVHDGFEDAIAASPSVERRAILDQMRKELVVLLDRHAPTDG